MKLNALKIQLVRKTYTRGKKKTQNPTTKTSKNQNKPKKNTKQKNQNQKPYGDLIASRNFPFAPPISGTSLK